MRLRLASVVFVLFAVLVTAGDVGAQSRGGGFFERLFGPAREVSPPGGIGGGSRGQPVPRSVQPSRKKQQPAAPAVPAYPALEIAPKDADARTVLVVGDFMASGLAWGLDQAFATDAKVKILDRSDGSSGLVRDDYFDWTASMPDLLAEVAPAAIVVMIGINDRQPIRAADGSLALRSPEWDKAYAARVDRFIAALKAAGRPVTWVGAPPMKSAEGSADMAWLNALYKERAEGAGLHFIDIWDGFADADGAFVLRGPDMDGQPRQLRSGDGINFTKYGRRKLAFYVEREIGGVATGPAPGIVAPLNPNETIEIGADGKPRKVGAVVSLTDPAPGVADAPLAGGTPAAADPSPSGPVFQLTVDGEAPAPPPGRADDYAWHPPAPDAPLSVGAVVDGIVILPAAAPAGQ